VLGDTNDHITHVLLHANSYLKDNRIPPEGFTLSQADVIEAQTKPAGVVLDPDFNHENGNEGSGSDTVHYRVPLNNPADSHSVSVRLLYQPIQPAFIDALHATGSQVTAFKQMVAASPPGAEVLATANAVIGAAIAGSGGGGGCALGGGGRPDPLFPALLLAATAWLGSRRRRQPWPHRRRK
jgi:hypothetical protein